MLTGQIRSQIDALWNAFWTGGISNPLEVSEQITYLLFLRRPDELPPPWQSLACLGTKFMNLGDPTACVKSDYCCNILRDAMADLEWGPAPPCHIKIDVGL